MKTFEGWRAVGRAMRWARQQERIIYDRTLMPCPIWGVPDNQLVDNRWRRDGRDLVMVTHHLTTDSSGGLDVEVYGAGWHGRCEPTSALQVLRVLAVLDLIPAELAEVADA